MAGSPIQNFIGGVFVPVTDLQRSIRFYSLVLGVPINPKIKHEHLYWFTMASGPDLILDSNLRRPEGDPYPLFYLDTSNIHGAYQFLKEHGVETVQEIQEGGGISFFNFRDPDGNVLMVCDCPGTDDQPLTR